MTAWTVKVEVYFALGSLQEARGDELAQVRKTWGAGNETIEDAYKKTDFELRLKKEDNDLLRLVAAVESGQPGGAEAANGAEKSVGRPSSSRVLQSTTRPSLERRGSERARPKPKLEKTGSEGEKPALERKGSERRSRKRVPSQSGVPKTPTRASSRSARSKKRGVGQSSNGRAPSDPIQ